jgi:integrase
MKAQKFNPNFFKGKKTVYASDPRYIGICTIWDWSDSKSKYQQRQIGIKYYAYKKLYGKQFCKSFESLEEAKKWRSSVEVFGVTNSEINILFKDVAEKYFAHRAGRVQPTTLQTMISKFKHLKFFYSLPVKQITPLAIDSWLQEIKKQDYLQTQHKTRVTYKHELSVLRLILAYYGDYIDDSFQMPIKKRHLDDSVVDPIRLKESRSRNQNRFVSRNDCEQWISYLFDQAKADPKKYAYAVLAHFQFNTGTRIGEACALDWKDIDLLAGTAQISKTVQWARGKGRDAKISQLTKTSESRLIPLLDSVKEQLKLWMNASGRNKGLIFSKCGFRPLEYRSIQYQYNIGFKHLGIAASSTHILRHSFATDFLKMTHNQLALSKLLGHKNLKQTEHYAKITSETTDEGLKAYNEALLEQNVVALVPRKSAN